MISKVPFSSGMWQSRFMDAITITITTYNEDGTVAEVAQSTATVVNSPEELAALFAAVEVATTKVN